MNKSDEQPKRKRRLRKLALWIALLLPFYAFSYAVLSFTGGWIVAESGRWRPFGLAEIDCIQWQPRFGYCERFTRSGSAIFDTELLDRVYAPLPWNGGRDVIRADFLGYIYAPLILLDQSHIHRTIPLWRSPGDPDSGVNSASIPPISEWHPARIHPFAGRFPYTSSTAKPK